MLLLSRPSLACDLKLPQTDLDSSCIDDGIVTSPIAEGYDGYSNRLQVIYLGIYCSQKVKNHKKKYLKLVFSWQTSVIGNAMPAALRTSLARNEKRERDHKNAE
ncbi:MAG: hypothetical protein LCH39_06970 [Proteobacteria bacterium]|nr:hypothetical protein [Pseudomonadota bacterium]